MDNTENKNQQIPPLESVQTLPPVESLQTTTSPQDPIKPVKKKRSTLIVTVAFMAGALTYAIFNGAYNFYFQTKENELLALQAQSESEAAPNAQQQALVEEKSTKISEEEVAQSVDVVDCLAKPAYSELVLKGVKMKVDSIDLYDGIQASSGSSGGAVRWTSTPTVTNYKCEVIKISDIEVGDRINIYVSKASSGMLDTKMLQKATK